MSEPEVEDVAGPGLEDAHAQVTHMAEQALLGGLLLSRAARATVRPWLTPEHFRNWTHAAVYRAVLDLEDAGDVDDGDEAAAQRPMAVAERAGVQGATPEYVSALAGMAPRTDHIPHYGRLVVRGALRRAAGEQAIRLAQQAVEADFDDRSAVRGLAVGVEEARRAAAELAGESALGVDVLSDEGWPLDRETPPSEEEVLAARVAGGPGAVPMTEAMLRETALLAALVREPALLDEPEVRQLTPYSFTNRACGVLFAAVRSLRSRGEAVDELLAVAEADAVAPWTEGFGPAEAREALTVSGGGGAAYLAQRILDHAAREEALRAATGLQAAVQGAVPASSAQEPGGGASAPRPVVVFVAGDPVAAEAAAVLVRDALARRGSEPVTLGRGFPPDHALHAVVDASGAADAAARYRAAEEHVLARGLDTVVHTRAADPEGLAAAMRRFRDAGFQVELAAVPLSEPQRRLSALDAHLQRGVGGLPPLVAEDRMAEALRLADNGTLADTVSVFRPDGTALYFNHAERLPDGTLRWSREPEAAATAVREAGRPWTAEELVRFSARYAKVAAQCGPQAADVLRTIAAQADTHRPGGEWRAAVALGNSAVSAPPPEGSRAADRIKAGGPVAALTERRLDAELVQTFRNLRDAQAAAERVADRARHYQALAADGGGPVVERLRTSGARPEMVDRAVRAATADAAYYTEQAERVRSRVQGLGHHASTLLREVNRRSQLSPRQRAQEDWLRDGRAAAGAQAAVNQVLRRRPHHRSGTAPTRFSTDGGRRAASPAGSAAR